MNIHKTKDRGIDAHFACICSLLLVSMKDTKNLYFLNSYFTGRYNVDYI